MGKRDRQTDKERDIKSEKDRDRLTEKKIREVERERKEAERVM